MIRKNKEVGKIGFVASAFDLLHAGHIKMLEDAKEQCDYLIAALQTDPTIDKSYRTETKNKPIQTITERQIMIESIRYVDEVIIYETENDLYNLLWDINPDVRILGSDWEKKSFTGIDLPIQIYFHERNHPWSTSDLRKRVHEAELSKKNK